MLILLLAACTPSLHVYESGLPAHAPAVVLLATQDQDSVRIQGTVTGELWVDIDGASDDRWPLRYSLHTDNGDILYERTLSSPVQVREYLDFYSAQSGYDIMSLIPTLGAFPVQVPLLDGATEVWFELRDEAGDYQYAGRYALADVEADDVGISETVEGWDTRHRGGDPASSLDIAIVGDGYTASEQGLFQHEAEALVEDILASPPFSTYADMINIYRVDAISEESGASYDTADAGFRRTAFGSIFALEWVNQYLGTHYSTRSIFQTEQWEVARAVSVVPWDLVVILVNTEKYGGMAVHYATVTTPGEDWPDTGVHELGHIAGVLGDEYLGDDCIVGPTLGLPHNIGEDLDQLPWAYQVAGGTELPTPDAQANEDEVGAFEGAYNCDDLYRGARNCKMRNSASDDFCPVCSALLTQRFFEFADLVDEVTINYAGHDSTLRVSGRRSDLVVTVGDTVGGVEEELPLPEEPFTLTVGLPAEEIPAGGPAIEEAYSYSVQWDPPK